MVYLRALSILLLALSVPMAKDLTDLVVVVKPKIHDRTKSLFLNIAQRFAESGNAQAAAYFNGMAQGGHGSGFIMVEKDSTGFVKNNFIITNRHVVEQAVTADIQILQADNTYKAFQDCQILYVDQEYDLAVLQFSGGANLFDEGFELDYDGLRDLDEIFSAGFPGLIGRPGWQVAPGAVTNKRAFIPEVMDPRLSHVIQHSAPIDGGNSGGPLLKKDPSARMGFKVVGVNTWQLTTRQTANLAIPSTVVHHVLNKARASSTAKKNLSMLKDSLIYNCNMIASLLSKENPDKNKIRNFIGQEFVSRFGWASLQDISILTSASSELSSIRDSLNAKWSEGGPIEAMKEAIFYKIWVELSRRGNRSTLTFDKISFSDLPEIGKAEEINTEFRISGQKLDVQWKYEYGWKISRINMANIFPPNMEFVAGGGGSEDAPGYAEARPRRPNIGLFTFSGGYGFGFSDKINEVMILPFDILVKRKRHYFGLEYDGAFGNGGLEDQFEGFGFKYAYDFFYASIYAFMRNGISVGYWEEKATDSWEEYRFGRYVPVRESNVTRYFGKISSTLSFGVPINENFGMYIDPGGELYAGPDGVLFNIIGAARVIVYRL